MITDNQKDYILSLYEDLGQEYSMEDIESLSRAEAHEVARELLEIKNEME